MKHFFAPNELQTWQNVQNGLVRPFGASQLILSEKKNDFSFAPNELKTWQNVQSGSVRPFGAGQLILSEKNIWNIFSLRMSSKLDKTFTTDQLGHLEHHSSFWARTKYETLFPLQMNSKFDKTFRTAKLGHLEHHSSFWARKIMNFFRSKWTQNLTKRSERLS